VARLLQRAGVQFGYLYEDDLYAGALTHDLGADDVVAVHARRVVGLLRKHGVREVITIDPHTTNMLRSVYPGLIDGYDIRVRSYLEVLAERSAPVGAPLSGKVVVHDPCVYARYENVIEAPRKLLAAAGLEVGEPESSGLLTWCCGGPVEALFPAKAAAVAASRVAQLREIAPDCVTMCPICLVNLRKSTDGSMRFRDISDYLVAASAPLPDRGRAGGRRDPDLGVLPPRAPALPGFPNDRSPVAGP
jgi:Fe-S oxidoreductase